MILKKLFLLLTFGFNTSIDAKPYLGVPCPESQGECPEEKEQQLN